MSEVAGRMAIQEGAKYLEKPMKGKGILLGGVPGVPPAKVVVLGGGIVGTQAAKMAAGFGAQVTILDVNQQKLEDLDDLFFIVDYNGKILEVNTSVYEKLKIENNNIIGLNISNIMPSIDINNFYNKSYISKKTPILTKTGNRFFIIKSLM